MMFRSTKPPSPRGSWCVNVETIGGRRSRQLLPKARLRNQTGWSAPKRTLPLRCGGVAVISPPSLFVLGGDMARGSDGSPLWGPQLDMTPGRNTPKRLPDDAELRRIRPRTHKVCPAEGRKKVVQRHHIREIHGGKLRPVAHMVGM